ncbi:carbohydrate kinase [Planosporangium flavigriseum]|uniref:Putative fructokinase n=1 Tax=Planosporangium flavigriseum TaxID=373681 RepID=A0A8J3PPP8_9ACTN|nr:carbohydrate kinase [Planosporangium flavigriseum]NJC67989.1 carbohydrate kinase [Planosporangium flavigriseum]GIG76594.1 putative fructokinase [Planosporangium flavigriseum]
MFVVCGEALIDLVPAGPPATWRAAYGGGPTNTAVALARLGTPTALVCRLSGDNFGRQLREYLANNGVDLRLAVAASEPTTLAVVAFDERGGPDYQFYVNGTADWQWSAHELPDDLPPGTLGLHIGSLASILPPGAAVLREWITAHRADTTVIYDVNVRPALLPERETYRREVRAWLDAAHVVKASVDDLDWLYPGEDALDVARRWIDEHDLSLVLVTAGPDGAVAVPCGQDPVRAAGIPVDVADTVGAGDTFTAAFLHRVGLPAGISDRASLAEALRFAVAAAALACTREGAQPPTLDEVEDLLAR